MATLTFEIPDETAQRYGRAVGKAAGLTDEEGAPRDATLDEVGEHALVYLDNLTIAKETKAIEEAAKAVVPEIERPKGGGAKR